MFFLFVLSMIATGTYFHPAALMTFATESYHLLALFGPLAPTPPGGDTSSVINDTITSFTTTLKQIGRPIAILSLALLAISWLASGVNQEWAASQKGVLVKMLMGGILLGIAPDVVSLVMPTASAAGSVIGK